MPDPLSFVMEVAPPGGGCLFRVGPVDMGEGVVLVDRHLAPNGWSVNSIPLTSADRLAEVIAKVSTPTPVFGADLFVALRRAVVTDSGFGDPEDPQCPLRARLLAHIDSHRPAAVWTADEQGGHDRAAGPCPTVRLDSLFCRTCSPMYDPGGEWDEYPLHQGTIAWPCEPLRAVAAHHRVPLDGAVQEVADHG